VVCFLLFGGRTFFMQNLMGKPPHPGKTGVAASAPVRAGGIMTGATLAAKVSITGKRARA